MICVMAFVIEGLYNSFQQFLSLIFLFLHSQEMNSYQPYKALGQYQQYTAIRQIQRNSLPGDKYEEQSFVIKKAYFVYILQRDNFLQQLATTMGNCKSIQSSTIASKPKNYRFKGLNPNSQNILIANQLANQIKITTHPKNRAQFVDKNVKNKSFYGQKDYDQHYAKCFGVNFQKGDQYLFISQIPLNVNQLVSYDWRSLAYVSCSKDKIDDLGWRTIVANKNLFCNLKILYIDDNQISIVVPGDLQSFPRLQYIAFYYKDLLFTKKWLTNPLNEDSIQYLHQYRQTHPYVHLKLFQNDPFVDNNPIWGNFNYHKQSKFISEDQKMINKERKIASIQFNLIS